MLKMLAIMAGIAALVVAQVLILQWDYWIDITDYFSIYNAPTPSAEPTLGYGVPAGSRKEVIRGVTHYVVLSPTMVGVRTNDAFLIARADGGVSVYPAYEAWRKACGALLTHDHIDERPVSRFSDRVIAGMQIAVIVLVVVLGTGIIAARRATATHDAAREHM